MFEVGDKVKIKRCKGRCEGNHFLAVGFSTVAANTYKISKISNLLGAPSYHLELTKPEGFHADDVFDNYLERDFIISTTDHLEKI